MLIYVGLYLRQLFYYLPMILLDIQIIDKQLKVVYEIEINVQRSVKVIRLIN